MFPLVSFPVTVSLNNFLLGLEIFVRFLFSNKRY